MTPRTMFCFLILTSHGSPAGLAVQSRAALANAHASNLADMLAGRACDTSVVISPAFRSLHPSSREPRYAVITAAMRPSVVRLPDKGQVDLFRDAFSTSHAGKLKASGVLAPPKSSRQAGRHGAQPGADAYHTAFIPVARAVVCVVRDNTTPWAPGTICDRRRTSSESSGVRRDEEGVYCRICSSCRQE